LIHCHQSIYTTSHYGEAFPLASLDAESYHLACVDAEASQGHKSMPRINIVAWCNVRLCFAWTKSFRFWDIRVLQNTVPSRPPTKTPSAFIWYALVLKAVNMYIEHLPEVIIQGTENSRASHMVNSNGQSSITSHLLTINNLSQKHTLILPDSCVYSSSVLIG
jgi:hypothetical protein